MTTTRTVRQRSCIACGKLAGKAELMRIVRDPSGAVSFDKTGRAPGRGAYVCSEECFAAACKKKKLDRALKATSAAMSTTGSPPTSLWLRAKRDRSRGVVYGQHAST